MTLRSAGSVFVVLATSAVVFGTAERSLKRFYYARTYGYHQTADVYWEDQHTLLLYLPDPTLFWSLRPGIQLRATQVTTPFALRPEQDRPRRIDWKVQVNRLGFRGGDFPARKPPGEFRIACFGDSRTMGEALLGYETYAARLEAAFEPHGPQSVRVLNLGHDGWSSHQGVQLLRSRALSFAPDVAVFAFGINDVDTDWGVSDRERARSTSAAFVNFQRTLDRSLTFYWAQRQFLKLKGRLLGRTRARGGFGQEAGRSVRRVDPREYEENLREFIRLCRQHDVLPVVLVVPPNPYRDWTDWAVADAAPPPDAADEWTRARSEGCLDLSVLERLARQAPLYAPVRSALARAYRARGDLPAAHRQFAAALELSMFAELNRIVIRVAREEDVTLVDTTPTFLAVSPYAPLYIDEVHPNAEGAALIARALADAIVPRLGGTRLASLRVE